MMMQRPYVAVVVWYSNPHLSVRQCGPSQYGVYPLMGGGDYTIWAVR